MNRSLCFKVAGCGIATALTVPVMFFGTVPGLAYVIPAISGMIIWFVSDFMSVRWALLSYIACCLILPLIVPAPEAVAFFITLFGWYPTLRPTVMKLKFRVVRGAVKALLFNIPAILTFRLFAELTGMEAMLSGLLFLGEYALPILWLLSNIAFVLYDMCVDQMMYAYGRWVKPRIINRVK
ncbi:MAG: hypothetical protein LBN40_00970 [Oscillospiraceae bacterium]|jgi:hypothetical protein|nr:hypothetical protein [Oscillospiraceae bacterium]